MSHWWFSGRPKASGTLIGQFVLNELEGKTEVRDSLDTHRNDLNNKQKEPLSGME